MNHMNQNYDWNERTQEFEHGEPASVRSARRKKQGFLRRVAALTLSAVLFGEDADLAVIKVAVSDLSSDTLSQIAVIAVGDSDALEVGEQVVAIGNALGYGQSVTTGIVSALNRSITSDSGTTSTYIQTDAAINPGNSGGALLNLDGELIGINTAKLSDTDVEGMGYAIPISDVVELISQLMTQTTDLSQTSSNTTQSSGITGPVWRGSRPAA